MAAITTTSNDVIFCGHGTYPGGADICDLPAGTEFWITQPVGSVMTDGPVSALVGNRVIDRLTMQWGKGEDQQVDDLPDLGLPQVLTGPARIPNLILHDLGTLLPLIQAATPRGPHHVITVTEDTDLRTLLARPDVQALTRAHVQAGTRLRIFWATCTAPDANQDNLPWVFHNAKAVAFAAVAYVFAQNKAHGRTDPRTEAAANAALDAAKQNPDDTAAAIAAAAAHDATTANQTKAL